LSDIDPESCDAVFYPGGYGVFWDLAEDDDSRRLIDVVYADGKPVAAVGHGVAAFRRALGPFGLPLVRGKPVTGASNSEEAAAGFSEVVPFLIEDMLKERGGEYSKAPDWQQHVVTSENLITGQNLASSAGVATGLLAQLGAKSR
jgi:putative intracellular protease/amidase